MGAYRPDVASATGSGWQDVRLISCDTFWSTAEGRRCTLEIFWSKSAGNVARVKQFAEVVQLDGTLDSTEIQNPVTCRLPDGSKDYMLEFIQNFTENKITNGYEHVATTADPTLPESPRNQRSMASSHDYEEQRAASASAAHSEGYLEAENDNSQDGHQEQNGMIQKRQISGFNLNEVCQYFHLPIHEAAARLGVGETWLKQKCRDSGIRRWPYRKVKSMDKIIERLTAQIKEGADALNKTQMTHLESQLREAQEKRRQLCLDAMSGADEDSYQPGNEPTGKSSEVPTPESTMTSFGRPMEELPPLKRIRTSRTPSHTGASLSTPKKKHVMSPLPRPMHNSFPGVSDAGFEAMLGSPAAMRLASAMTPNRTSLLTPHFMGSPLKFNIDFNF
eukprot:jgi/Tetstr1/433967/TSEL_023144.t1